VFQLSGTQSGHSPCHATGGPPPCHCALQTLDGSGPWFEAIPHRTFPPTGALKETSTHFTVGTTHFSGGGTTATGGGVTFFGGGTGAGLTLGVVFFFGAGFGFSGGHGGHGQGQHSHLQTTVAGAGAGVATGADVVLGTGVFFVYFSWKKCHAHHTANNAKKTRTPLIIPLLAPIFCLTFITPSFAEFQLPR